MKIEIKLVTAFIQAKYIIEIKRNKKKSPEQKANKARGDSKSVNINIAQS